jgi:hypothetical protein
MMSGRRCTRTPDGVLMISSRSSGRYVRVIQLWHFFCIYTTAYPTVISALTQTETYQIPGGGPTHGTDGPLNVSLAIEGTLGNVDEQFLQVARALDPARARAPPDTDSNDLSTINVYTVGILLLSLILTFHLLMRLRVH